MPQNGTPLHMLASINKNRANARLLYIRINLK